jgi:hypothetical protein
MKQRIKARINEIEEEKKEKCLEAEQPISKLLIRKDQILKKLSILMEIDILED